MRTLKDIKEIYKRGPVMSQAIEQAIKEHGDGAEAMVVGGKPLFRKGSNCHGAAEYLGWKGYDIFVGPKRQYASMGNLNVLVRLK